MSLAASLAKDGYEVWTPVEQRNIRVPRMNARRPMTLPMLPSYVFARARHLVDLLELAAMPVKPRRGAGLREPAHANFSVVHWHDRIPLISDEHFVRLREIEARRAPTKKAERVLPIGARARVLRGIASGMVGFVEKSNRVHTKIRCGDKLMEFETCILAGDEVSNYPHAALAA
jgi:hypothetical protein